MSNNLFKLDMLGLMDIFAEETDNEIVVATALGHYCGKFYIPEKHDEHNYLSVFQEQFKKYRKSIRDENSPNAIFLVDVTLITYSNRTFKMPFICLFIDQILGVSFGKTSLSE